MKHRACMHLSLLVAGLFGCGSEVLIAGESGGGGASSQVGGAGGAGGSAGAFGGWDGVGACGGGLPGPAMIEIRRDDGSGYCVDSTEVAVADWIVFHDHGRGPYGPGPCDGEPLLNLEEGQIWLEPERRHHPFSWGSWCDYAAYCEWAGKRLCGARDGGPLSEDTPLEDHEWLYACSRGGELSFPYGDMHEPDRCRGGKFQDPLVRNVASGTCEGGFPGLHDMAGNAAEAVNLLVPEPASGGMLGRFLGGAAWYFKPSCFDETGMHMTSPGGSSLGFRCCRSLD
jgi:formylglycine-generating enzyme